VFFGDIYQLEGRLLPDFDVVTLFHLCEFRTEQSDQYGAMTDRQLLDLLTAKTRPGGYLLFYTKSFAFDAAEKILQGWEQEGAVEKVGLYELLLVYRKKAA
jgi:aminoglycoside N3'-acetyltransferase